MKLQFKIDRNFNRRLIRECIDASVLSYSERNIIKTKNAELYEYSSFFEFDETQGFIASTGKKMLIVFRGSDSLKDWVTNARFKKRVLPYDVMNSRIRVHSGFIEAYHLIRDFIHAHIETHKPEEVIVTGHSLGGALAILCALDIEYNFDVKPKCIVFGCPRVGNLHFKRSFNRRIPDLTRVVNGCDIVTRIPSIFMLYFHAGRKFNIGTKRWYTRLTGSILDHFQDNYQQSIFRDTSELCNQCKWRGIRCGLCKNYEVYEK